VKTCLDIFLKTENITDNERELIKAIPDSEWNLGLISDCKIAAPGVINQKKQRNK